MGTSAVSLNPRLYLIWKLPRYCTPYHQDTHVPPHFTLYNQLSGTSSFHFLPLLVGLYATHVGRVHGPDALRTLLSELAKRSIGEVATIGPKQMLLILPSATHGVYVPPPTLAGNEPIARAHGAAHELSVIRAAELFVAPVANHYERELAKREVWGELVALTDEERRADEARLAAFAEAQEALCTQLRLTRAEWLFLGARLQRRWEAEGEAEPDEAGGADAE